MIIFFKGPSRDFVANLPFQAPKALFWDFGTVYNYNNNNNNNNNNNKD